MRRQSVLFVTLLALSVGPRAQAQDLLPLPGKEAPKVSPDAVVARLMSFDLNHDGRVMKDELPERMQPLLSRGDAGRDGALDAAEIRRFATNPQAPLAVHGLQAGQYGFGDEEEFFDSSHISNAIEDLRLASVSTGKALAIAKPFVEEVQARAAEQLRTAMKPLLTAEQMAAIERTLQLQQNRVKPQRTIFLSGQSVQAFEQLVGQGQGLPADAVIRLLGGGSMLNRQIESMRLQKSEKAQALAAVEQFKTQMRLTDADRTELLTRLGGLLTLQERDDLRAALERRPVVKQDGGFAIHVAGASVEPPSSIPLPAPVQNFGFSDLVFRQ